MQKRTLPFAALFAGTMLLAGCGASATPTMPTQAQSSGVSIVQGSSNLTTTAFTPNPITISRGGTVTWKNSDTTPHTSTSDSGMWNSGSIAPGGTFSMTFPSAGTFTYHCTLHSGMVGSVVVH